MAKQVELIVGRTYRVDHPRKGIFTMRVLHVDDTFASGVMVSGYAAAIASENTRVEGEEVAVRKSLCRFTEKGVS